MIGGQARHPHLRLVREYRDIAMPPGAVMLEHGFSAPLADRVPYSAYKLADKAEEMVYTLQLMIWREDNRPLIRGIPFTGIESWDIDEEAMSIQGNGYLVLLEGRHLQDRQFEDGLAKHRIKSLCVWNPAVHTPPPAGIACITRMGWQEG